MAGASLQDWLCLLRYHEFAKQTYVLDTTNMTVFHPFACFEVPSSLQRRALPWHVVMLLGKYHRKYIFHQKRLPREQLALHQVQDFLIRLQWQYVFRGSQMVTSTIKTKGLTCQPPPSSMVPPELCVWSNMFTRTVENCLKRARARFRNQRWLGANTLPLEVAALKWMQNSEFVPLPTDKDGGYCLVEKHFVQEAQNGILRKSWYQQNFEDLAVLYKNACSSYRKLAWNIAEKLQTDALYSQICRSLRGCTNKDLPRKLSLTVKTHKPPGDISFRNLHVGGPQPFGGLSAWLNNQLDGVLHRLPHLLMSSKDLFQRIKDLQFNHPVSLARIDLKEFFMSGKDTDFLRCVDLLPVSIRPEAAAAIDFLCKHQFLVADAVPGTLWKVQTGTGMGLIHSSQLCDLTYYRHAEHGLVTANALDVLGICLYLRFRDDILVVYNTEKNQFSRFVNLLKSKAPYVQLHCESISNVKAVMLDLQISVVQDRVKGRWFFDIGPYFKPTSLQVPLSCSSFHNPSVHVSWPFNQLRRLASLCSNETRFQEAKNVFVKRFIDAKEPFCLVSALQKFNPWPINKDGKVIRHRNASQNKWLVLPYHPVWQKSGLKSEIMKFVNSDLARRLWGTLFASDPPEVGIAWKNGSPCAKFIFCDPAKISG